MKFEMDTIQLNRILYNMPLKGEVCAKDLLPDIKPIHTKAYIVNTDLSDDPGEHWVAVYFRDKKVIYFDSYGMSPDKDYILPFIKRNHLDGFRTQKRYKIHGVKHVACGVFISSINSTEGTT